MRAITTASDQPLQYLRARSVARLLDCHVATVWRLVRLGRLPPPHRLSAGITAWRLDEIEAALRTGDGA